jgi:hypothetical protein
LKVRCCSVHHRGSSQLRAHYLYGIVSSLSARVGPAIDVSTVGTQTQSSPPGAPVTCRTPQVTSDSM